MRSLIFPWQFRIPCRVDENGINRALYIHERRVRKYSALCFIRGISRLRGWKQLAGFRADNEQFIRRIGIANISAWEFCIILGQDKVRPRNGCDVRWMHEAWHADYIDEIINDLSRQMPVFSGYIERGIVSPFIPLFVSAILRLQKRSNLDFAQLDVFLEPILRTVEYCARRAFVLELNIAEMTGGLKGGDTSRRFRSFSEGFCDLQARRAFYDQYPVLLRLIHTKISLWETAVQELMVRLDTDRSILSGLFGISEKSRIISVGQGGDTHNAGRSVTVIDFSDGASLIYKPRSVSLELAFQEYLKYFNSVKPGLNMRTLKVCDRGNYGWVEFVRHEDQRTQIDSDLFHYKLGFLTAIVYSINGVDIFFENLISAGQDPVIIDLETMFHTNIERVDNMTPAQYMRQSLYSTVMGIGILPQPGAGAENEDIFDISVIGARKDARAPYKIIGLENFGRSDMRISEVQGWIPETKASSVKEFSRESKYRSVYRGIEDGFDCLLLKKEALASSDGVIERIFRNARRRLIVRDTKTYGVLQQDELHPDLLRSQIDREWHWDNLWSELRLRPNLSLFISSELSQVKIGDIPYFSGKVNSHYVFGGDDSRIDISTISSETPIEAARGKLQSFTERESSHQKRIAASMLGLAGREGLTAPIFDSKKSSLDNAVLVADFLCSRIERSSKGSWCDTTINPVPKAKEKNAVSVTACDPFLYDGMSGIAMYFFDIWRITKDTRYLLLSAELTESIFSEIKLGSYKSVSGYSGLSSVVYFVNKCRSIEKSIFGKFDKDLDKLIDEISNLSATEKALDFLLGISGMAAAIMPYVKRTRSKVGLNLLHKSAELLKSSAREIIHVQGLIPGLDYMRGLSHGLSGISLSLNRLGKFLQDQECIKLAGRLLEYEFSLVQSGGWTDTHRFEGEAMVAWCHGSSGISLALEEMPELRGSNENINQYYVIARENTIRRGFFRSKCLCHGTAGNILCLDSMRTDSPLPEKSVLAFKEEVIEFGFESLDRAQTLGIGLMTGVTGIGYYFLRMSRSKFDCGFLSLS